MDMIRDSMICVSKAMQEVKNLALKVAKVESPVLITGESGVGKGLVAKLIYQESSRSSQHMVTASIANFSNSLIESELFGHVKGSFTGAHRDRKGLFVQADKGVLFLDEIGDISAEIQLKLLRALEENTIQAVGSDKVTEVDVKMIFATNADLEKKVSLGTFRKDFFYRINVFPIQIPPLRNRKEDIIPLARYFIGEKCRKFKIENPPKLSEDAQSYLLSKSWPGNVRQLQSVIESALIKAGDNEEELKLQHVLCHGADPYHPEKRDKDFPSEDLLLLAEKMLQEEFLSLERGKINILHVLERTEALMMLKAMETTFPFLDKSPEKIGMGKEEFARKICRLVVGEDELIFKSEKRNTAVLSDKHKEEKERIMKALTESGGIQTKAGLLLGRKQSWVSRKVKQYGLQEYSNAKLKKTQ